MGVTRSDVLAAGQAAFHRLAYGDWGEPTNPNVLFCVHGLARNRRDFDVLAAAMEDRYRVICPDVLGRGDSDWARDAADYNTQRYLSDMSAVLARIDASAVDWVGTSMGGLIGMTAAAMPGSPIRRLVINDIGPFVPNAALRRIADYVGNDPRFEDMEAARSHFRSVYDTFGEITDRQWAHIVEHGVRPHPDGGYRLAYDPDIAIGFRDLADADLDMWALWDRIDVPVLVLRGAESDILPADVAREMSQRGPKAEIVEFPGWGHPPMLMDADQIGIVRDWLLD